MKSTREEFDMDELIKAVNQMKNGKTRFLLNFGKYKNYSTCYETSVISHTEEIDRVNRAY